MASTTNSTNKNTNLFYQLYSTSNDVASSGFVCSSAVDESDTSFDITDSTGEITDSNGDTLSSIDLSGIHADEITEYYTETKILQPYSAYLLQGNVTGDTYAAQFFPIIKEIQSQDTYESYINVKFDIHYTSCDEFEAINIDTYKLRTEPGDVCTIIQDKFDSLNIPISVTIKNLALCDCTHPGCSTESIDYLVFQSSSEGYSFYVHSVLVSAIGTDYENYNKEWVDYTDTPFIGANIDFDYILDIIRTYEPRLIGNEESPDYSNVPCDIYKYFISIAPLAINDSDVFKANVKKLKEFAVCFDEYGTIISGKETTFSFLASMYPDIYAYYWGNEYSIMNKYNIQDILKMLNAIAEYVFESNVAGPYELVEDYDRRIYNQKYPNGAMRGIVLVPDWNSATDDYSVLKLAHVSDFINIDEQVEVPKKYRVEGFWCNECVNLYMKVRAMVKINTLLQSEYEVYKKCDCNMPLRKVTSNEALATCVDNIWTYEKHNQISTDDGWTTSAEYSGNDSTWSDYVPETHEEHHQHNHHELQNSDEYVNEYRVSSKYDFLAFVPGSHPIRKHNEEHTVGLYRYMQYLNENDLWQRIGEGYISIGAKDDYQSSVKNLQNSVLIYNPNSVPVRVNFMVFS